MKKLILMFVFLTLIAVCACRKAPQDTTTTEAFLVGYRAEKCICCPGTLVKIGLDTFQFEKFPESSPKVTPIYPHKVNIKWQRDTSYCVRLNDRLIVVSEIEFL
jgi:hypothetical protein